ncbi:MAG TPA: cyclic nucleotide-binding domain-containing protein [Myxococcaceae bacterium]
MAQRDDSERTELAVNPLYMMEGMEALKSSNLFGSLSEVELKTLFNAGERRPFQDGEQLVKQGDPLDALWVITSGRVELAKGGPLIEQGAPTFFGERALANTAPAPLACRAVAEGEALRFTRASLLKLSREQPKLGVKILWALLENSYRSQEAEED